MRFSRLYVTAALLALASPAAAEKKAAKGCELEPQYDAVVSAHTKLAHSFNERGKVILAQKPISRDDVILMNAYRDAHVALSTLLIEILNRLGPNCLPKGLHEKMIASARKDQELERLPVPPPKPGGPAQAQEGTATPNEKLDAVVVNIGMAYAVTDSDLCIKYKSSYKVSNENVMKYVASESVPADEVNARLRDKTFLGKVGHEWGVRHASDPQAGCDEIIRSLGPNGIGLLQPVSTADNTKSKDTRVFGEDNLKDIVDSADHNTIRFERDYKNRTFNGVGAFTRANKANLGIGDSIAVTISVKKDNIVCFVDKGEADTIADWKGGTKVRFRGTISGTALLGGTLQLKDCVMTRLQ